MSNNSLNLPFKNLDVLFKILSESLHLKSFTYYFFVLSNNYFLYFIKKKTKGKRKGNKKLQNFYIII